MIIAECLVNKNARHLQWGRGVVESVSDRYFTVRFFDVCSGEKKANFKFPDAFETGYLTIEN